MNDSITLTFGDCMENHVGMQKIGTLSENGYSLVNLLTFKKYFNDLSFKTELINLGHFTQEPTEPAFLLVIHSGIEVIHPADDIYKEQKTLTPDKQYYDTRRSKVLNKQARWNLCFDSTGQVADFENKKGTIVRYDDVPLTKDLRNWICHITGDDLKLEANYYYDINKTGINFHGDVERKKVIGVRLGKPHPLVFKWYRYSQEIGDELKLNLQTGDIYIMSEKATGFDWKRRSIATLRHAAGCKKYTT